MCIRDRVYPSIDDTKQKMMDMDNLIHDVAVTGLREGGRVKEFIPYEKPEDAKIYHDDMMIHRSEFLGESMAYMPGTYGNIEKVINGSNSHYESGANGKAWDVDMDSSRRQRVIVKISETNGLSTIYNHNVGKNLMDSNRMYDTEKGRPEPLYGNYGTNRTCLLYTSRCV